MSLNRVASKYAASLLYLADEQKILEPVASDVASIKKVISSAPQLRRIITDPTIRPSLKSSVLKEIFKGGLNELTDKFLNLLIQKNRIDVLPEILDSFAELMNEHLGIVEVSVTSASEMSSEQVDMLRKKLEELLGKKVSFTFKIDPSIIGGFIAKAGDTVIDSSVGQQLRVLKNKFLTSTFLVN